ncbi:MULTISPECIES: NADH-quinone oxidoreductase subunit NuoF [unclassified Sedimentibacter]|uniref:NADH-quinone oxidoreductase subunit NuoF n=1 Tax=unclassified Sedimentibacter TaxID=2649220 RepID=UPI0027E17185|nr:NADH-quinone oxidoreductase subunit NuoF [Sedimentibacter sp. MB35-C1]WMJ78999.1 NADH-quinone oxidoreductase subunit NuoF [Sedimentibacter sp. MB35-C1]
MATCGISAGAKPVLDTLVKETEDNNLNNVKVVQTGCIGMCTYEPIVEVYVPDKEKVTYTHVTPDKAKYIIDELMEKEAENTAEKTSLMDSEFYKKQKRVALRNCGIINPENIYEYIAKDGYMGLGKALTEMTPSEVITLMKNGGLRGRGGAGFPTGVKWSFAAPNKADQKYIICNADEGDPGAFMDRSVLEGDPHAVLEAMAIAGYAIGATKGFIYVRAEYPVAVKRLEIAISQARELGLLGKNIFESGFDFDIETRLGAGAFVCGEETALMQSIEGKRGMSRVKPPFPANKGLWGKPSVINNVETLANIPQIVYNGPEWFRSFGTEKSPGTKVFALGGKIKNTGLVEVPMGTTLREVIYDIGGGCPNGKEFKAVQTGGPSGGCLTKDHLDTPIEYETLMAVGSMMGSGGMIVMDEDNCMVDIARFFLEFTVDESCGKCTPCRVGTKRMLSILEKITSGKGTMEDLEELESLAQSVKDSSLCGLGQTAPNPVLSTLRYFKDEYIAHVVDKKCPAKHCKALLTFEIDKDKCTGCTLCSRKCPVNAIDGTVKNPHVINQELCIKCGNCYSVCRFGAVEKN